MAACSKIIFFFHMPGSGHVIVEDKKARLKERIGAEDDTSEVEREDEQPTVVVLKAGDIGPEEFKAYRQEMKGGSVV